MFIKGANLEDLMNIFHDVITTIPSQVKKSVEAPIKIRLLSMSHHQDTLPTTW
jgi:hypothetical protein